MRMLLFVDDATSQLMQLRFVASESTFETSRATRDYPETPGKPVTFCSEQAQHLPGEQQRRGGRRLA